jgi:hypothetical protein
MWNPKKEPLDLRCVLRAHPGDHSPGIVVVVWLTREQELEGATAEVRAEQGGPAWQTRKNSFTSVSLPKAYL